MTIGNETNGERGTQFQILGDTRVFVGSENQIIIGVVPVGIRANWRIEAIMMLCSLILPCIVITQNWLVLKPFVISVVWVTETKLNFKHPLV